MFHTLRIAPECEGGRSQGDLKVQQRFVEIMLYMVLLKDEPVFLLHWPFDTLPTLKEMFRN